MSALPLLFVTLALVAPVAAERQVIGIFAGWGAFRDRLPARCFATALPIGGGRPVSGRAFASVGHRPRRQVAGQVHFRLSGEKRQGSAIILRIDDLTFQLAGGGVNAWAPNARADAEIVRALRTGVAMSVETRSLRGGRMRDRYRLRGAATAIDAAAIDCARR